MITTTRTVGDGKTWAGMLTTTLPFASTRQLPTWREAMACADTLRSTRAHVGKVHVSREGFGGLRCWTVKWTPRTYVGDPPIVNAACTCGAYWSVIPPICPVHSGPQWAMPRITCAA